MQYLIVMESCWMHKLCLMSELEAPCTNCISLLVADNLEIQALLMQQFASVCESVCAIIPI